MLWVRWSRDWPHAQAGDFSKMFRPPLGPTLHAVNASWWFVPLRVKHLGCKPHHCPAFSAEGRNQWCYTSAPFARLYGIETALLLHITNVWIQFLKFSFVVCCINLFSRWLCSVLESGTALQHMSQLNLESQSCARCYGILKALFTLLVWLQEWHSFFVFSINTLLTLGHLIYCPHSSVMA